eukprot:TRINITY_DN17494_c0_g1_i5.p1 TRINITY_DN17494_c0_g1~~TRINITY_DN17494_c0_g1_i5.p1  ORF type:complete len:182 (+),score=40.12 TRINITY_DN17494_c0_g1_i5:250-795(+)
MKEVREELMASLSNQISLQLKTAIKSPPCNTAKTSEYTRVKPRNSMNTIEKRKNLKKSLVFPASNKTSPSALIKKNMLISTSPSSLFTLTANNSYVASATSAKSPTLAKDKFIPLSCRNERNTVLCSQLKLTQALNLSSVEEQVKLNGNECASAVAEGLKERVVKLCKLKFTAHRDECSSI